MCCFTHGNVVYGPPASDARMRCRCGAGDSGAWQCDRQADAEDLLCAVCRVCDAEPVAFINPPFGNFAPLPADGEVIWVRGPFPGSGVLGPS